MHYPDKKVMDADASIGESKNKEVIDFVDCMKYGVKRQLLGIRAVFLAIDELISGDMTLSPKNKMALKNDNEDQSKEAAKEISLQQMTQQVEGKQSKDQVTGAMHSILAASPQPTTDSLPTSEQSPKEQATAKDVDAGEHEPKGDVPGDKKSRLRVSESFRQAMKQAVIAMTSENVNNFSAAAVYGKMQKINSGLAAPFNPSNMSHGKRELQGDPYKLEFMDGSYKLTEECLAQLGKSASPIGDLPKDDSVKKRGKAK